MTNSSGNAGAASFPAMMVAHLGGALADDGVRALNRAMSGRPELRREFAGLLLQQVMLSEIGREAARKPAAGLPRRGVLRSRTRAYIELAQQQNGAYRAIRAIERANGPRGRMIISPFTEFIPWRSQALLARQRDGQRVLGERMGISADRRLFRGLSVCWARYDLSGLSRLWATGRAARRPRRSRV